MAANGRRGPMVRGIEPDGTATGRTIERHAMTQAIKENLDGGGARKGSLADRTVLSLYSELAVEIADCGQQFREAGVQAPHVMLWLISQCRELMRNASDSQKIDFVKEMRMMTAQMMACEIAEGRTKVLSKNQYAQSDSWLHRLAGQDNPDLGLGDQLSMADKSIGDIATG